MRYGSKQAIEADPILRTLWSYWTERRGQRSMPAREDIDPVDIPSILPHLQLVEPVDGRFRFRLAGTAIVTAYGAEMTGKYVDDVFPGERGEFAIRSLQLVQDTGRPLFASNKYTTSQDAHVIATRIMLPLWTGGVIPVGMTLMGTTFEYATSFAQRAGIDAASLLSSPVAEFVTD
jgi:hypothetical protein